MYKLKAINVFLLTALISITSFAEIENFDLSKTIQISFKESVQFHGARSASVIFTPNSTASNPNPHPIEIIRSSDLYISGQTVDLEIDLSDICSAVFNGNYSFPNSCETESDSLIDNRVILSIGINDGSVFGQISSRSVLAELNTDGIIDILAY